MPRASRLDTLFALLDAPAEGGFDGTTLTQSLDQAGLRSRPGQLLHDLLALEQTGHVAIDRPSYAFTLTDRGRAAAYDLGPGRPVEAIVVMCDLVDFVAYTELYGDRAAVRAAQAIHEAAASELGRRGGRVVKRLGDGVLGMLPPHEDPVPVVTAIADRTRRDDGERWPLRAAARAGEPIDLGGDLYGAAVNVVARLCALAQPGELVLGLPDLDDLEAPHGELVDVRGLARPVDVVRVAL